MKCVKCKKEKKRFTFDRRTCNACYKRRENKYFTVRFGIKKPSKGIHRRAKIKRNGGFYTTSEWDKLRRKYHYRCVRCGKKEPEVKLQADHVISVDKGGSSWISNIQPMCGTCNGQKGTKNTDYRTNFFEKLKNELEED